MFDPVFMLLFVAAEILLLSAPVYWLTKHYLPKAPTLFVSLIIAVSGIVGFHFVGSRLLLALPYWDFPFWERIGIEAIPGLVLPGLVWFAVWLIFRKK